MSPNHPQAKRNAPPDFHGVYSCIMVRATAMPSPSQTVFMPTGAAPPVGDAEAAVVLRVRVDVAVSVSVSVSVVTEVGWRGRPDLLLVLCVELDEGAGAPDARDDSVSVVETLADVLPAGVGRLDADEGETVNVVEPDRLVSSSSKESDDSAVLVPEETAEVVPVAPVMVWARAGTARQTESRAAQRIVRACLCLWSERGLSLFDNDATAVEDVVQEENEARSVCLQSLLSARAGRSPALYHGSHGRSRLTPAWPAAGRERWGGGCV